MIPPNPSDLIGKTLGPYRVIREIGRGGMAVVYEAYQGNLARPVAIKMLLPRFRDDPDFVQRFLREARSAASLSHSNIATIYDVVEQAGQYVIAMQLAPGISLKKRLEQTGRLPQGRVQHIIGQVAAALDHAHAKGLVHRDVKPDNIIIGPDDHAFLTDFGLAKAFERDAALTVMGTIVGTPEYMSPEQALGQPVDKASDVYSLGVVLYEMLTGQRPFTADNISGLVYLHVHRPPPPIQVRALDLSPKIQTVLNRALAKQPDRRFRSAGELASALATVPVSRSARTPALRLTPMPRPPASISEHEKTKLLRAPTPLPVPAPIPTPPPKRHRPVGLWLAALLSGVVVLGLTAFLIWQFLFSSFMQSRASSPALTASPTTLAQITTGVPTQSPTAALVAAANNTPAPSLTETPTAAPPATPTATLSQSPATSTVAPTMTPIVTPTASRPTTSQPNTLLTSTRPTPVQPSPARITAPALLGPPDKESIQGRTTFRWQAVELPPGAAYEVVWWRENASPDTAEGFASSTLETTQEVDIAAYAQLNGRLPVNQLVRWTVIVVNNDPYKRLTLPSASSYRGLTYVPSSGGSAGGCTGPGCGK